MAGTSIAGIIDCGGPSSEMSSIPSLYSGDFVVESFPNIAVNMGPQNETLHTVEGFPDKIPFMAQMQSYRLPEVMKKMLVPDLNIKLSQDLFDNDKTLAPDCLFKILYPTMHNIHIQRFIEAQPSVLPNGCLVNAGLLDESFAAIYLNEIIKCFSIFASSKNAQDTPVKPLHYWSATKHGKLLGIIEHEIVWFDVCTVGELTGTAGDTSSLKASTIMRSFLMLFTQGDQVFAMTLAMNSAGFHIHIINHEGKIMFGPCTYEEHTLHFLNALIHFAFAPNIGHDPTMTCFPTHAVKFDLDNPMDPKYLFMPPPKTPLQSRHLTIVYKDEKAQAKAAASVAPVKGPGSNEATVYVKEPEPKWHVYTTQKPAPGSKSKAASADNIEDNIACNLATIHREHRCIISKPVCVRLTKIKHIIELIAAFLDYSKGIKYLRDNGVMHQDISSTNLMLDDSMCGNFGPADGPDHLGEEITSILKKHHCQCGVLINYDYASYIHKNEEGSLSSTITDLPESAQGLSIQAGHLNTALNEHQAKQQSSVGFQTNQVMCTSMGFQQYDMLYIKMNPREAVALKMRAVVLPEDCCEEFIQIFEETLIEVAGAQTPHKEWWAAYKKESKKISKKRKNLADSVPKKASKKQNVPADGIPKTKKKKRAYSKMRCHAEDSRMLQQDTSWHSNVRNSDSKNSALCVELDVAWNKMDALREKYRIMKKEKKALENKLREEDFPKVNFWHKHQWTAHEREHKNSGDGKDVRRGRTHAVQGVNVMLQFVKNKDVVEHFREEMKHKFPMLGYCENDWKIEQIATNNYPSWYSKQKIKQEDDQAPTQLLSIGPAWSRSLSAAPSATPSSSTGLLDPAAPSAKCSHGDDDRGRSQVPEKKRLKLRNPLLQPSSTLLPRPEDSLSLLGIGNGPMALLVDISAAAAAMMPASPMMPQPTATTSQLTVSLIATSVCLPPPAENTDIQMLTDGKMTGLRNTSSTPSKPPGPGHQDRLPPTLLNVPTFQLSPPTLPAPAEAKDQQTPQWDDRQVYEDWSAAATGKA
ncbi:hypothetical protein DXG01_011041 [Tephrocybe rancida]|nr:hypothetical protein DXG01_011041 [Tephrocybe rancida]